jgi:hypothetical protein
MAAIQLAVYYICDKEAPRRVNWVNLAIWLIGFILYRGFMDVETPIACTVPVMS